MKIGECLENNMKAKNIDQRTLSRLTGIPYATLNQYIRGYCTPSAERLNLLENFIGEIPAELKSEITASRKAKQVKIRKKREPNALTISVADFAKMLGICQKNARKAITDGKFDFAFCIHNDNGRCSFYINRKRAYQYAALNEQEADEILGKKVANE